MKSNLFSRALLCTAAALQLGAVAAEKTQPIKMPELSIDDSALTEAGKMSLVGSYADVIEPVQKAVVSVYSSKSVRQRLPMNPLLRQFFGEIPEEQERKQQGLGSGVIVSPDGYILTNNHVVEGADELKVALTDDRELVAKVIGTDPKTDVAVIKIDATDLPFVTLADSGRLRVGDVVFAVGNPLGVGQTVTMGIVSAKGRTQLGLLEGVAGYEDFIQTDAAINMGNSGGALVDARGRLVGINSAIISPNRGSIGIGFAIPVNLAASVMRSLIETGTVSRGFLGVSTQTVTAEEAETLGLGKEVKGVAITEITPDSPADKAGLKRGDVILALNGKALTSVEELRLNVSQILPGTKVTLKTVRAGKVRNVEVVLGTLAERPNQLLQGVEVTGLTDEIRRRLNIDSRVTGLVITSMEDNSPHRERLVPNVVIVEINRVAVTDLASAKEALRPGRNLLLVFFRGVYRYISITME